MHRQILCRLALSLAFATSLPAATFTVINTNASGVGSLLQAMVDANINPGADVIHFNIVSGGMTISPTNALPGIVEPLTIDGSTQPGFGGRPLIELNGVSAGAATDGIKINTSNSIIRALVINRFLGDGIEITNGGNNRIEGCYLGLNLAGLADQGNSLNGVLVTNSSDNIIGGFALTNRNYIAGNGQSGLHLGGVSATNNALLGNYIGLNLNNAAVLNGADGVRLNAPDNIIGGSASGARNIISGNTGQGIEITAQGRGALVRGNYIGTDDSGTLDRGNSTDGLLISAGGVTIGGTQSGEGNLISGNGGDGIEFNGVQATNNLVLGNFIGTALGGSVSLANGANGLLITTSSRSNVIGGVLAGQANVIAFNGANGISVAAGTANTNNPFRGNSIFANGDLGIELGATGATLNDTNDVDVGANQLQNFPVLSLATNSSTHVTIVGSLASAASAAYVLDFYANTNLDLSGHGEGQIYLGNLSVLTDGSGRASFVAPFAPARPGQYLSATATDAFGNTSEFSRWTVSTTPSTNASTGEAADFVFIIDASVSMAGEIAAVKAGLGSFVTRLNTNNINARFAVVLFGGPTEIIQDFTPDQATTEAAFDVISVNGAVSGVHNNHNLNPEAGLEAIRIVLNAAANNTIQRNNVGGAGALAFRPEARKNLILVTDENSDLPFYVENRQAGQTGTEPPATLTSPWQAEINATAEAVIANGAFINLLVSPSGVIRNQYGDPNQSVSDSNLLNFNPDATLTNLINAGFGGSLEAQVLSAGLVGRAFNIGSVNTTNFIANFFAAKVEEISSNPIPPPRLNIAALPSAVRLTWTTNSFGYQLETNRVLSLTNGWGVLTTNYSILGTNYAVTNSVTDALRFYRLRK